MFKGSAPLNFKMAFGRISYVTQEVGACSKGRFQTLVMHPFTWLQLIPNCPCTKLERKDGKDPFINGMCEGNCRTAYPHAKSETHSRKPVPTGHIIFAETIRFEEHRLSIGDFISTSVCICLFFYSHSLPIFLAPPLQSENSYFKTEKNRIHP